MVMKSILGFRDISRDLIFLTKNPNHFVLAEASGFSLLEKLTVHCSQYTVQNRQTIGFSDRASYNSGIDRKKSENLECQFSCLEASHQTLLSITILQQALIFHFSILSKYKASIIEKLLLV
jgi:hypothetical protein